MDFHVLSSSSGAANFVLDTNKMQLIQLVQVDQTQTNLAMNVTSSEQKPSEDKCTICGITCADKTAFNAHIKAHLKEKLNFRRELKMKNGNAPELSESNQQCQNNSGGKAVNNIPIVAPSTPPQPKPKIIATQSQLMAELAACKPVPPEIVNTNLNSPPTENIGLLVNTNNQLNLVVSSSAVPKISALSDHHTAISAVETKPNLMSVMPNTSQMNPMPKQQNKVQNLPVVSEPQISVPMSTTCPDNPDMSYEMEMNRIDFNNDLSSILDQIERDFESPGLGLDSGRPNIGDTFADHSDVLFEEFKIPQSDDLMGLDHFTKSISLPSDPKPEQFAKPQNEINNVTQIQDTRQMPEAEHNFVTSNGSNEKSQVNGMIKDANNVVQTPYSLAKVGPLPPKALAVLGQLPQKFLNASSNSGQEGQKNMARFVNVVKMEQSNVKTDSATKKEGLTVINIEYDRQNSDRAKEGKKVLESYKAIEIGGVIKLVLRGKDDQEVKLVDPSEIPTKKWKKNNSNCPICNKSITVKNMARHIEKHASKSHKVENKPKSTLTIHLCPGCKIKFPDALKLARHRRVNASGKCGYLQKEKPHQCKICPKTFSQKGHLNRHEKIHFASINNNKEDLRCRVCDKICKNKISLMRHRTKHLACIHCSVVFESKNALQDHLLREHTQNAIMSVEKLNHMDEDDMEHVKLIPEEHKTRKADSFLVSAAIDDEEDEMETGFRHSSSPSSITTSERSDLTLAEDDIIGESLADISNANLFNFSQGLNDEFCYSANLF